MRALLVVAVSLGLVTPAAASATTDAWLTGLTDRVIDDVAAGKRLVVEVHVPLCAVALRSRTRSFACRS
jgi:hypothetical protein